MVSAGRLERFSGRKKNTQRGYKQHEEHRKREAQQQRGEDIVQ